MTIETIRVALCGLAWLIWLGIAFLLLYAKMFSVAVGA